MAPLENRNDDLVIGLAHRWIDLEGVPKHCAQVEWAGDLVSLQPSTQLQSMRLARGLANLFCHEAQRKPCLKARIELAKLTILFLPVVKHF